MRLDSSCTFSTKFCPQRCVPQVVQTRFLTDPDANDDEDEASDFDYRWEVPVTFKSSANDEKRQVWFHMEDDSILM